MSLLRAKEKDLKQWSGFASKARYDYDSDEYRIEEMLNNDFFGLCCALLKKGDLITITDCEDQIITVRVDNVDRPGMQVWLSSIERLYAHPIAPVRKEIKNDLRRLSRLRPANRAFAQFERMKRCCGGAWF